MTYQIGQVIHGVGLQPLWRNDGPRWYPLTTAPQAELLVSSWLMRNAASEAWYPTKEKRITQSRGRAKRVITRVVPEWPRYVFALCPGSPVSWDALYERSMRKITGVVTMNGEPATIDEAKLLDMKDVPKCLEAVRQAQIEAQRIKPGDKVRILSGEMSGWEVTVAAVDAGMAAFILPLLGGAKAEIEIGQLRKM